MRAQGIVVALALLVGLAEACGARTDLGPWPAKQAESSCGDGLVDDGEACDDGNALATDACIPGCVFARCGDGHVQADVEACDDGNEDPADGCMPNCAVPTCGNGIVEPGETCDDGNANDADNCPSRCLPAICGDGFVHAGFEECDMGPLNTDTPAFLLVQGALKRAIVPVSRGESAVSFYSYSSASAHTGFEEVLTSRLFLYLDAATGQLSLVTIHGVDKDASAQTQPETTMSQSFFGLPEESFVSVSDDTPKEFRKLEPTMARGDWNFNGNTDGGVLSGLPIPGSYQIEIAPTFGAGIERWEYIDGPGDPISLDQASSAWILALGASSACRPNCTIPRCGDSILDGGEVCDDGNTSGGDGCAEDCKSAF